MWRYLTSLLVVTVVFAGLVFVSWTPTAKAGGTMTSSCTDFCEEAFICACALKLGGNLRETRCQFNTEPTCQLGFDYGYEGTYCNCDPDPKCFSWKENDRVWLSFPQPYNFCD
ncbi:MAG TPA: hypothetical protein VGA95_00950 [Thermodesulfobacteriota bacterium]